METVGVKGLTKYTEQTKLPRSGTASCGKNPLDIIIYLRLRRPIADRNFTESAHLNDLTIAARIGSAVFTAIEQRRSNFWADDSCYV